MEKKNPKMEFEAKVLFLHSAAEKKLRTKYMQTNGLCRDLEQLKSQALEVWIHQKQKYFLLVLALCFPLPFSRLYYILINI